MGRASCPGTSSRAASPGPAGTTRGTFSPNKHNPNHASFQSSPFAHREPTPTSWPSVTSHFGIIDTAGFDKDRTFWYRAWWGLEKVLHVFPHWNWEGREGEAVEVWSYSNYAEVELLVNGESQGRKEVQKWGHAAWNATYASGFIEVVGYEKAGDEEGAENMRVETSGQAVGLVAKVMQGVGAEGVDRDGGVGKVEVQVVDADGRVVPVEEGEVLVKFEVSQGGRVVGTGSGNNVDHVRDGSDTRAAYHGKCMGWVMAEGGGVEELVVKVSADGLGEAQVTFDVVGEAAGVDKL